MSRFSKLLTHIESRRSGGFPAFDAIKSDKPIIDLTCRPTVQAILDI
jgi:hypothetical protein